MLEQNLFYVFAFLAIVSATLVIFSKNPVHSVLYLILTFINTVFILILIGCDFLALLFTIVYLGAIAILFLFIVMMLDIKYLDESISRYLPIGIFLGLLGLAGLILTVKSDFIFSVTSDHAPIWYADLILDKTASIEVFGQLLYTHYAYFFLMAGMILLLAMISAIVLTVHNPKKLDI